MLILGMLKEEFDALQGAPFSAHSLKSQVTASSVSNKHFFLF